MLRTVNATRYVTPFREGGSLPALVEADDLGLYVVKFRGAGQGPLALVAEVVAGEIGRALGLNVPEIVLIEVDEALGLNERDEEIRDLLRASAGLNVGMDFLPGAVMFDPAAGDKATPDLASKAVWFDSFITNVDRTARNPNLLYWHKTLRFIDHGASMYFHHNWQNLEQMARSKFAPIREHVLLPWASQILDVDAELRPKLTGGVLSGILDCVPEAWLPSEANSRESYVRYFQERLEAAPIFVEEAIRAYAQLV